MNERLFQKDFPSPVGLLHAISSDKGLCLLEFVKADREILLANRLKNWFPDASVTSEPHPVLDEVDQWLKAFFKREFSQLPSLRLVPRGTAFEMDVWKVMQELAPGETMTYAALAGKMGKPNASRAVGNASRRNSIALIIPCHRVVGSDGKLTGYGGGLEQKKWLLDHEHQGSPFERTSQQSEFAWS